VQRFVAAMAYHAAVVAVAVAAAACHAVVVVFLFAVASLVDAPFLDFVASLAAVASLVAEFLLVVFHAEAVDSVFFYLNHCYYC